MQAPPLQCVKTGAVVAAQTHFDIKFLQPINKKVLLSVLHNNLVPSNYPLQVFDTRCLLKFSNFR
jgi:hypothetical protein